MSHVIKKRHVLALVYESSQNPDFRNLTNSRVETHAFCPHDLLHVNLSEPWVSLLAKWGCE